MIGCRRLLKQERDCEASSPALGVTPVTHSAVFLLPVSENISHEMHRSVHESEQLHVGHFDSKYSHKSFCSPSEPPEVEL